MIRPLIVSCIAFSAVACGTTPKGTEYHHPVWTAKQVQAAKAPKKKNANLQAFYGEPKVKYKRVCKIAASGANFLETKFTKMSDFEPQFRRRAASCKGANAFIIQNMFAFEHGSAFADGVAIAIEPES